MAPRTNAADDGSRGEETLDLVAELLGTAEAERPRRLARLPKPILVQLAAVVLGRLQRVALQSAPGDAGDAAGATGGRRR